MLKLPDFATARVLVVGDVMLDRYWSGSTQRISPEAPVPVVQLSDTEARPGGAGNVALNLAALGATVSLVGLVGDDEPAQALKHSLQQAGVEAALVTLEGAKTITKLRVLSRHQQLIRLDVDSDFQQRDTSAVVQQVERLLPEANLLVLSDYAKGSLQQADWLIALARSRGIPVVVDPKGHDFTPYRGATVITPNLSEFEAIVGECHSDTELAQRGQSLRQSLGLEAVLLTRSEKGMSLFLADEHFQLPTKAREVFDVTGAGDTVVATLAAALAANTPWRDAVTLANLAAGLAVAKLGAAAISAKALQTALESSAKVSVAQSGLSSAVSLREAVAQARARGERVVMTNGCFDVLHPGHVRYLQEARALGDRLIVAINTDESVRALKGETRPVNPLEDRALMLSSLRAVSWVVAFSESTPADLIHALQPDVLVKGGDYHVEDIAGADSVLQNGGEVRVLDFVAGYSTTEFLARVRQGDEQ